mmetsp:Transcript_16583/g.15927  ORF Transcript_16583/g.15927 Transcript_16583/m.15927 type:complete len:298 (+) Transcript_16583:104-997(+)|eukprot:CAMPEP_0119039640 /NCGR_PEP_ID=MMETSP1177-20130426/9253_1 /TAXON_ID=2985 /ORGANISM="Ochromonas sp, Strain CCMP1899" /LENGTH=297 /DNA_ID=CAMNT_0007003795 /DNA_START=98 /DNA_END=991 /DNA_ORIENTATION=-
MIHALSWTVLEKVHPFLPTLSQNNHREPYSLDERALRYVNRLEMPEDKVSLLWDIFCQQDKNGKGHINISHYFESFLKEPYRPVIGEAIMDLVGAGGTQRLTFCEFLEATFSFATFGTKELIKMTFFIIDREKCGMVPIQGLKLFLHTMWSFEANANSNEAIKRLDRYTDSFGQITYAKFESWVNTYPTAYYPMFRLQVAIMRTSFGEDWWTLKTTELQIKEKMLSDIHNMGALEKNQLREEKLAKEKELVVYSQMGPLQYYVLFWRRKHVRAKIGDTVTNFDMDDERNKDIRFCFD